jgi:hypothetical protein
MVTAITTQIASSYCPINALTALDPSRSKFNGFSYTPLMNFNNRDSGLTPKETIRDFGTSATAGLSPSSLAPLLARYGPNEFELPPAESLLLKFIKVLGR